MTRPDALDDLAAGVLRDVASMAEKMIPLAKAGEWSAEAALNKLAAALRDNAAKLLRAA